MHTVAQAPCHTNNWAALLAESQLPPPPPGQQDLVSCSSLYLWLKVCQLSALLALASPGVRGAGGPGSIPDVVSLEKEPSPPDASKPKQPCMGLKAALKGEERGRGREGGGDLLLLAVLFISSSFPGSC